MCVAILCPKVFPSTGDLIDCEGANPDGGGVAWHVGKGKVRWKKGVTASEIAGMIRTGEVTTPAMIHFRIATAGGKSPELCHPFPVSNGVSTALEGEASSALIHNGHWSGWNDKVLASMLINNAKLEQGPWSDTRAIAYLAKRYGTKVFELIGSNQKIGLMEPTGRLLMWGSWVTEKASDGEVIYYSNSWWKGKATRGISNFASRKASWATYRKCSLCGCFDPPAGSTRFEMDCKCSDEDKKVWQTGQHTKKLTQAEEDAKAWAEYDACGGFGGMSQDERCEVCKWYLCRCDVPGGDTTTKAIGYATWDGIMDKPRPRVTTMADWRAEQRLISGAPPGEDEADESETVKVEVFGD